MKERVLVTGASGFVGKSIAGALHPDYEVLGLSRNSIVPGPSVARRLQVDLSHEEAVGYLRSNLPDQPLDAVLHVAARTPRLGRSDLEGFLATNIVGTQHLLEGLPRAPRRLAYVSAVDVYGRLDESTIVTEDSPVAPVTYYAVSKYAGERVAMLWARTQGVSATILRLGQVYGSGDPYTKVIPTFCQAVSGGLAPVVHGSGDEIRQPVHIRDVVAAVRAWLRKPPGTTSEILLIAGMEQITIRDLARLVMKLADIPGNPGTASTNASYIPGHHRFDQRRTEAELGWRPRVSLRDGLSEILKVDCRLSG